MQFRWLLSFAVCFTSSLLAHEGSTQTRTLLPNLTPISSYLKRNRLDRKDGRLLLRFPNTIANIGEGPMEVEGHRVGDQMQAFQVIYTADGGPKQLQPIGEFMYHPQHHHWHLVQVAEYRLRDSTGNVIATSDKISFCLADTKKAPGRHPGTPRKKKYVRCVTNPNAQELRAGISVGWADMYSAARYGQWIDVTDVPPGNYLLESEVNPDGIMQEATREDNRVSVPVTLR